MNIFFIILFYIVLGLFIAFFVITFIEIRKFRSNKKHSFQNKSNTDIDAAAELKKELDGAKKLVLITTGNCNKEFYNRSVVKKAIEDAAERKINIRIISGQIENIKDNPIFILANNHKNIQLYINQNSYLQPHFRIIDNRNIFIESIHEPNEEKRYFSYFVNNSYLVKQYIDIFYGLLSKSYIVPSEIDFIKNNCTTHA